MVAGAYATIPSQEGARRLLRSQTESRKRAACLAHVSQHPETSFYPLHERMNRFRGMECGRELAEGFVRHCQNLETLGPGR